MHIGRIIYSKQKRCKCDKHVESRSFLRFLAREHVYKTPFSRPQVVIQVQGRTFLAA